ncbi:unnamed protein product [Kuraishia capsulata CBS 1993]|uniref:GOLD domain-containing protein n=1 Tax=Kuraishia capsulata CBS 1993 TaxID=1382522 RepID=W6MJF7_9ASCO|nr:uncharacterized protein KUCA_T00002643001 [Kuraishia capsulata CBS 1993]CDK26669.1 unnamed protein product [Kuraishia capsulata CBS 1993]
MKLSLGILTVLSCVWTVVAHNVVLPSRGKQCFFETLKTNDELSVTFQVGNRVAEATEQLEADFWISSPSGQLLEKLSDASHGEITIRAKEAGKYEYCFSNERSTLSTKDVTFNVHGVVYVDVNDPSSDNLDRSVRKLLELVYDVKNEQGYLVVRERTHRNTAESTNSRVKYWSAIQLIVVILNSVFQVLYLKRFFEVKTTV